jgi:DNA-binding response OmpR family regulator
MPDETDDVTVLIVDDESQLLELFEAFLKDRFTVLTATDGETALERIDVSIDAVLLDRRMPGMSGDEVLERLRDRGAEVPVAMTTAINPDVDILDMPFDEYLTKPVGQEELHSVIERLVTRSEFDSKTREFFRLAAKQDALADRDESESEDEIRRINERMDELRSELGETLDHLAENEPHSDTTI